MTQLTHDQYDALERAILRGTRVAIERPGRRELVVVPLSLRIEGGREAVSARNPTTGHDMKIYLDEVTRLEVIA